MNSTIRVLVTGLIIFDTIQLAVWAQPPSRGRSHRVVQKGELRLLPSNQPAIEQPKVEITIDGDQRIIQSNGIPDHATGRFPNRGNPNPIAIRVHQWRVPASPTMAKQPTPLVRGEFGVAVNGVPFDPFAAEYYEGATNWQYEPMSGAINLGLDASYGHVQPNGKYHYHGIPVALVQSLGKANQHSPLIGWAADGFPIYSVNGFSESQNHNSAIAKLRSSYRLKNGNRPGQGLPSGTYDGTFVQDYEFVKGSGDLDECNGRICVTPEFPQGTYAYFLTEDWPVIPRFFRGIPSRDFVHHGTRNTRLQ